MNSKTQQFILIEGKFNPTDAQEVLSSLFTQKIEYHKRKNFSHEERYGMPDKDSVERIAKLISERNNVSEYFKQVNDNIQLEIKSQIIVSLK